MKLAIIGYGKMGHAIERIAQKRGHEIVATIDVDNIDEIDGEAVRSADVAIEFTRPDTAVDNYERLLRAGVPVVSGTTGWHTRRAEVERLVKETPGARLFWTSNFSIGVNIFFAMNKWLAEIMERLPQYTPTVNEVHHVHKLDHPSGTAVTIAQDIDARVSRLAGWSEETTDGDQILVTHERIGEVPGTHTVTWDSPLDSISMTHVSKSRDGLALGAVMAAEWLRGAPAGFHGMEELMKTLLKA